MDCTEYAKMLEAIIVETLEEKHLPAMLTHFEECISCRILTTKRLREIRKWAVEGVDACLEHLYSIMFPPPRATLPEMFASVGQRWNQGKETQKDHDLYIVLKGFGVVPADSGLSWEELIAKYPLLQKAITEAEQGEREEEK